MKELLIIMALMGTSEEEATQKVIQAHVPQTIITEELHIDTSWAGRRPTECWTTNIYHTDGSVQTKVQCQ